MTSHCFYNCPTLPWIQLATSSELAGRQPSGCDIQRTVAGSLVELSVNQGYKACSKCHGIPDSFFFNSTNPITKPLLTFKAFSPVTGWVQTEGW